MNKFSYLLVGLLTGMALMVGATAFGATNGMIGKSVQGEMTVTFNSEPLDTAVIIDGKSYLPMRSISEAAGLAVSATGNNVDLKNEEVANVPITKRTKEEQLAALNKVIEGTNRMIAKQELTLKDPNGLTAEQIEVVKKNLAEWKSRLVEQNAQKAVLESE